MTMHVTRLGEVCEINPRMPKSLSDDDTASFLPMAAVSEEGQIAFEEQREVGEVKKGYTYFERGDVLVAKITPCFENGKAARTLSLSYPIGFGSTEFHVLRAGEEIDASYLFHLIWNARFREVGANNMTGSAGQKRVPADFLKRLEVPLPPLDEQRRIAAILDKADALRRKRKRALELLDGLAQSVFLDMFGDPVSNPMQHETASLSQVAEFFSGNSLPEGSPFTGQSEGFLLLKVSDLNRVGNEEMILSAAAWTRHPGATAGTCMRSAIVFPKRGGAIATNKKRKLFRPAILDPNLMAVAPKLDVIEIDYLYAWFQTFSLEQISSGSSVPQLNKQDLAPLRICVPSKQLQEEFVKRCNAITAQRELVFSQFEKSQILFSSLQHRAFTGQL